MIILTILIGVLIYLGWLVYEALNAPTIKGDDNTVNGN